MAFGAAGRFSPNRVGSSWCTPLPVAGKSVPYFKPGKELRERVNGGPGQASPRSTARTPEQVS